MEFIRATLDTMDLFFAENGKACLLMLFISWFMVWAFGYVKGRQNSYRLIEEFRRVVNMEEKTDSVKVKAIGHMLDLEGVE